MNDLMKELAFDSVVSTIKQGLVPVNENLKIRINQVEEVFDDVITGAQTILDNSKNYFIVEDLREILERAGYSFNSESGIRTQREKLESAVREFKKFRKNLGILENNGRQFYSGSQYELSRLYEICKNMKFFYEMKRDNFSKDFDD